jgi:hypothetical protein
VAITNLDIRTVGYGDRPPFARDGRGGAASMCTVSASKSTCSANPTNGSPSFARRSSRSCSANKLIRGFLIVTLAELVRCQDFTQPVLAQQRFFEVPLMDLTATIARLLSPDIYRTPAAVCLRRAKRSRGIYHLPGSEDCQLPSTNELAMLHFLVLPAQRFAFQPIPGSVVCRRHENQSK